MLSTLLAWLLSVLGVGAAPATANAFIPTPAAHLVSVDASQPRKTSIGGGGPIGKKK